MTYVQNLHPPLKSSSQINTGWNQPTNLESPSPSMSHCTNSLAFEDLLKALGSETFTMLSPIPSPPFDALEQEEDMIPSPPLYEPYTGGRDRERTQMQTGVSMTQLHLVSIIFFM